MAAPRRGGIPLSTPHRIAVLLLVSVACGGPDERAHYASTRVKRENAVRRGAVGIW